MMETVASWKSLNSTLTRHDGASVGQVMMYSIPKSRGYRAGKNGDVRIPPPVLLMDFEWPLITFVPERCNLFPAIVNTNLLNYIALFCNVSKYNYMALLSAVYSRVKASLWDWL